MSDDTAYGFERDESGFARHTATEFTVCRPGDHHYVLQRGGGGLICIQCHDTVRREWT